MKLARLLGPRRAARNQAGRSHHSRHSDHRVRFGRRGRDGHEGRRVRLHSEARGPGALESAGRARHRSSRNCCARIFCCARNTPSDTAFRASSANTRACRRPRTRCSAWPPPIPRCCCWDKAARARNLFARAIHHLSPRRQHPFVALNCAAIPEGLVENELFGHERGAYTGAGSRKVGKMELANRGTIFLDEIAELPLARRQNFCACWRNAASSASAARNWSTSTCASWRPPTRILREAVAAKTFREDLYFRIAAVPITIPPLSERGDDVLTAGGTFSGPLPARISQAEFEVRGRSHARPCAATRWPGNVRELQNTIERAAILSDTRYDRRAGPATPRPAPSRWAHARRDAGRRVRLGRHAAGSRHARGGPRRAVQDRIGAEGVQVEQDARGGTAGRFLQNAAE